MDTGSPPASGKRRQGETSREMCHLRHKLRKKDRALGTTSDELANAHSEIAHLRAHAESAEAAVEHASMEVKELAARNNSLKQELNSTKIVLQNIAPLLANVEILSVDRHEEDPQVPRNPVIPSFGKGHFVGYHILPNDHLVLLHDQIAFLVLRESSLPSDIPYDRYIDFMREVATIMRPLR